jgi:hypothetical protein
LIMRIALCLFTLAAACGTPVRRAPANEKHAESPASRPCPRDLAQRLGEDDANPLEIVACVAGNFPRPGWAAAYRKMGAQDRIGLAILDGAGLVTGGTSAMTFGGIITADLDGDGVDELIADTGASAMFGDEIHVTRRIVALALRGDQVAAIGEDAPPFTTIMPYGSLETLYECRASHELERDPGRGMRLVLKVQEEVGHRDDRSCPAPGRHAYRLVGDKLVEVK